MWKNKWPLPITVISRYCTFFQNFSIFFPIDFLCSFLYTKGAILYVPWCNLMFSLNIAWTFFYISTYWSTSFFFSMWSISLCECRIIYLTNPLWVDIYYVFVTCLQLFCYNRDAATNSRYIDVNRSSTAVE